MGFLNEREEDDDELPGASGLHVDLELRVCPDCRREALPWQETCAVCGATPVPRTELAPSSFALPADLLDGLDTAPDEASDAPPIDPDDGSDERPSAR